MDILVVCCNGNDYRLLFNGYLNFLNISVVIKSDHLNIFDFDFVLRRLRLRVKTVERVFTSITWGVRVVALEHGIIVFEVMQGSIHIATFAAIIATKTTPNIFAFLSVAVNELLLREWFEFFVLDKVGSLESSYGWEGPACAAMSLVLHWGYATSLNPIYIMVPGPIYLIGNIGVVGVEDIVVVPILMILSIRSSETESKDGRILLVWPVRKLVVAKGEVDTIRVVVLVNNPVPI